MWPTSEVPYKQLVKAAEKLGLAIKQGSKHTIAKQVHTGLHTQIPRHPRVKRETAKSIVEYFIVSMRFSEEDVARALGVSPPLLAEGRREVLERKAA